MNSEELQKSRQRHLDMTQLEASRTLRAYSKNWFTGLRERIEAGGGIYILCSPICPHEIFEAMDIPYIPHAWYSGLVAAKRQSAYYSDVLEKHGYHKGLERYGSLAYAVVLDDDQSIKPWGGLPKASAVVSLAMDRGAGELAAHWGVPFFGIEQPSHQVVHPNWWEMSRWLWEDLEGPARIDLLAAQLQELVRFCEELTGRKLDIDRLRMIVDRVNRQEQCFDDVRTAIVEAPKLPVRLGEVMSQVMGIQYHRGTEWALKQAEAFRDEVRARAAAGQWVCPNEKHRFMYVGAGLWQRLDFFASFEESHGVVFARSNYLSIACDGYIRCGLRDPVRALASRYTVLARQMHVPPMGGAWAAWEARRHRISGALQLDRGRGARWIAKALEGDGVPVLDLNVDPVDGNKWDDEAVRAKVTRFIETRVVAKERAA